MRAGFEIDEKSRAARFFSGIFQCKNFGVFDSVVSVEAFSAHIAVIVHNDCAHTRIRRGKANAFARQFKGAAKKFLVSLTV